MKRMSALLAVGANDVCDAARGDPAAGRRPEGQALSAETPDKVQDAFASIGDDVQNIKDAQGELNDERKQQVQAAVESFESQVRSVSSELGSDLSRENAKTQLKSATTELSDGLRKAFQPVDCS